MGGISIEANPNHTMMDNFENLGNKAEQLSEECSDKSISTDCGVCIPPESTSLSSNDDEHRVFDEIESFCMNCHEDVRIQYSNFNLLSLIKIVGSHAPPSYKNPFFQRSDFVIFLLLTLQLQNYRGSVC